MTLQDASDWLVANPQVHIEWSTPLKGKGEHTGMFWFVKNNQMYADGIKVNDETFDKIFPYLVRLAKETWEAVDNAPTDIGQPRA